MSAILAISVVLFVTYLLVFCAICRSVYEKLYHYEAVRTLLEERVEQVHVCLELIKRLNNEREDAISKCTQTKAQLEAKESELDATVNTFLEIHQELRRTITTLDQHRIELEVELEVATEENTLLYDNVIAVRGEKEELEIRLTDAIAENTVLDLNLAVARYEDAELENKLADAVAQNTSLEEDLNIVRDEKTELRTQLANAINKNQNIALEKDLNTLRVEKAEIGTQLANAINKNIALEKDLNTLRVEKAELGIQLANAIDNNTALEKDLTTLRVEKAELEKDMTILEQELGASVAKCAGLDKALSAIRAEKAAPANDDVSNTPARTEGLIEDLSATHEENVELETQPTTGNSYEENLQLETQPTTRNTYEENLQLETQPPTGNSNVLYHEADLSTCPCGWSFPFGASDEDVRGHLNGCDAWKSSALKVTCGYCGEDYLRNKWFTKKHVPEHKVRGDKWPEKRTGPLPGTRRGPKARKNRRFQG